MESLVSKPQSSSEKMLSLVERAVLDPNFDAAKLQVLLDVQLKWEANEARKKFEEAFESFKRSAPEILKTKHVSAGQAQYTHAELDKITPILTDALLAVGITHQWRTSFADGKPVTVTCLLKGYGHTEEAATLCGPPDTSGSKNNIQAIGSTVTYLERYTLLAACGIAAKGTDNDGKTEGMPEDAVTDYMVQMKDASHMEELKKSFGEAYSKAKKLGDNQARDRFVAVYEARKRELL